MSVFHRAKLLVLKRIKVPVYLIAVIVFGLVGSAIWTDKKLNRQNRAIGLGYLAIAEEEFGWNLDSSIDMVELYEIGNPHSWNTQATSVLEKWDAVDSIMLEGSDAAVFCEEWRSLEFGSEYSGMCHAPGFILRFFRGKQMVFETSLCLACQNFVTHTDLGEAYMGFRKNSESGTNLVQSLKALFPDSDKWVTQPNSFENEKEQ